MRRFYEILLGMLLMFFAVQARGQSLCPAPGIWLDSQEAVNRFGLEYGGCDTVQGDLVISGADIEDLGPLKDLKVIEGSLIISGNKVLQSLKGLEAAREI